MDDIEHVSLARRARSTTDWLRRCAFSVFSLVARLTERRVAAISSCVLVCSEVDRTRLIKVAPRANVRVAQNTATVFGELPDSGSATAIFVGMAHYPPNREAILWLAHEVWPRVVSTLPGARLLIVGDGTRSLPIPEGAKQIDVMDFVPDLETVYRAARLVTCPIRRGSGTRIKIIEAAINGRAVVSTPIGAEGLLFEDGSEILLADDAATFARRCIEVLGDPPRAAAIGRAAQHRARDLYSQERVTSELVALCRQLIDPAAANAVP
jgi:glycosyltransferase involved in cell wall biosynthesis